MKTVTIQDLVMDYEVKVQQLKDISPKLEILKKQESELKKEIGQISASINRLTSNFKTLYKKEDISNISFIDSFDTVYQKFFDNCTDNGSFGNSGYYGSYTISKTNTIIYKAERVRNTKTMPATDEYYILCYKNNGSNYYPIKAYNIRTGIYTNLYIGYFANPIYNRICNIFIGNDNWKVIEELK